MQSALNQVFNQTMCLLPIDLIYWENAFEACAYRVSNVCANFTQQEAAKLEGCLTQSLFEQMTSSSGFSSDSITRISNSTVKALNLVNFQSYNYLSPCNLFSRAINTFYDVVEKDSEMTTLVDRASDAISAFFGGINALFYLKDNSFHELIIKKIPCAKMNADIKLKETPTPNYASVIFNLGIAIAGTYALNRIWRHCTSRARAI